MQPHEHNLIVARNQTTPAIMPPTDLHVSLCYLLASPPMVCKSSDLQVIFLIHLLNKRNASVNVILKTRTQTYPTH